MDLVPNDLKQLIRKFNELNIDLFFTKYDNVYVEILKLTSIRYVSSLIAQKIHDQTEKTKFINIMSILLMISFVGFLGLEFYNKMYKKREEKK